MRGLDKFCPVELLWFQGGEMQLTWDSPASQVTRKLGCGGMEGVVDPPSPVSDMDNRCLWFDSFVVVTSPGLEQFGQALGKACDCNSHDSQES